jgi:hypothetical protein
MKKIMIFMVLLAIPVLMKAQTKTLVDRENTLEIHDTTATDTIVSLVHKDEVDNIYVEYGTVFITYSASLRTGQAPGFIKLHYSEFNDFASNADLRDYLKEVIYEQYTLIMLYDANNNMDTVFYTVPATSDTSYYRSFTFDGNNNMTESKLNY